MLKHSVRNTIPIRQHGFATLRIIWVTLFRTIITGTQVMTNIRLWVLTGTLRYSLVSGELLTLMITERALAIFRCQPSACLQKLRGNTQPVVAAIWRSILGVILT